jgi:hypothetical protein
MDDLLQKGIEAYKAGKRDEARKIFISIVKQSPDNEHAWGRLHDVANNDQERIQCLKQILRINPRNEKANQLLNQLTKKQLNVQSTSPVSSDQIRVDNQQKPTDIKPNTPPIIQNVDAPVFNVQCLQDILEVYEDKLKITPTGVLALINKGMKGTKTIPFLSINAIQYKNPGSFTNGYIQFTLSGGMESRGGILDATKDENTVMFAAKDTAIIGKIKDYIESQMQKLRNPNTPNQSSASLSSELEKLAELKNKGILTDDEFQSAKKRLLG